MAPSVGTPEPVKPKLSSARGRRFPQIRGNVRRCRT